MCNKYQLYLNKTILVNEAGMISLKKTEAEQFCGEGEHGVVPEPDYLASFLAPPLTSCVGHYK